jgi:prophage regulatory protein
MNQPVEILKIPEARVRLPLVLAVTGYSRASLYRMISDGKFPKPTKLGERCSVWTAAQVMAHLSATSPDSPPSAA